MRLTLKPTASYPVPSAFHSHELPTPKLPPARLLKVPKAYLDVKQLLVEHELAIHSILAADKAMWLQIIVDEVVWDLEDEEVVVTFVDRTEARWDLGSNKSCETFEDSEQEGADVQVGRGRATTSTASTSQACASPYSDVGVLSRLETLSIELRSAYEDITTSSVLHSGPPLFANEQAFEMIMSLAANPAREVPPAWFPQTWSEPGYQLPSSARTGDILVDEGKTLPPSQFDADTSSPTQPRTGRFISRRRPTRLSSSSGPTLHPVQAARAGSTPHDFLSLIHLLSTIRSYLADLFALTVIPKLKASMASTYSIWAIEGAIAWCRRRAIEASAEAGELVLDLLNHDLDAPFETDSETSGVDYDSSMDCGSGSVETGWGIVIREEDESDGDSDDWSRFIGRAKARDDNPLASMRNDSKLRCWAEDAIERDKALLRKEWLTKKVEPNWIAKPGPWEVSMPAVDEGSEADDAQAKTTGLARFKSPWSAFSKPRTLAPEPPTSPPEAEVADEPPSTGSRSVPSNWSSAPSDPETEDEDDPTAYSDYFSPEDLVGEGFLPSKLPKTVVTPSLSRGKSMEQARARLHVKLNEVAGLQKKMYELQEAAAQEQVDWDESQAIERRGKIFGPKSSSGLRTPGPSSTSPPPSPRLKKPLPLRAQPLRQQTADRSLTDALSAALVDLEPQARVRKDTYDSARQAAKKRSILATPKPRHRQKFNLETLKRVVAIQGRTRDEPTGERGKKRKRTQIASKAVSKRRRKGTPSSPNRTAEAAQENPSRSQEIKREPSRVDVLERPPTESRRVQIAAHSPAADDESASSGSASRLSLTELAQRRVPLPKPFLPPSLNFVNQAFTELPQEDIVVDDPEPSFRFPQLESEEEELTDDEEAGEAVERLSQALKPTLAPAESSDRPGSLDAGASTSTGRSASTQGGGVLRESDETDRRNGSVRLGADGTSRTVTSSSGYPVSSAREDGYALVDPVLRSPEASAEAQPGGSVPPPPPPPSSPSPQPESETCLDERTATLEDDNFDSSAFFEARNLAKQMRDRLALLAGPPRGERSQVE
ncbi:hypothetical protein JCM10212_002334 [Sporobolomyces blumeae]